MLLFEEQHQQQDGAASAAELVASHQRESALAKELGRVKAENAELQTKLLKATASLKNAKVTAREALIEMADQNAKLVQAFVDKKRECKQLKAAAREDRKAWQQRLQTMELELQSNKQHIQQLMQQLHAIAAKQVSIPQPDIQAVMASVLHASGSPSVAAQQQQQPCSSAGLNSSSSHTASSNSSSSMGTQLGSSRRSRLTDPADTDACSRESQRQQQQQQQQPPHAGFTAPALGDATNRLNQSSSSGWKQRQQQQGSSPKPGSSVQQPARLSGAENATCAGLKQGAVSTQQPAAAGAVRPAAAQVQADQQQQHDSRQLLDAQRQMQELQQRALQLEAENAELRSAHAEAAAQIGGLKLQQQAEQLKQQGNRCFQAQSYEQAAAAYSQALALGVPDTSLTAVLLCNRAAAQHAAGQYLDAIADCCLAHQLDARYPRALQRRAEAYIAIQHYSAAVADLHKLLEQATAGSSSSSSSSAEVAARLASAQAKQRTHGSTGPNHYLILGLDAGASAADVKAAYKRLALKHHPDKATGPEAKAAAESVFVLITAANSVLSDPGKRAVFDAASARNSFLYGGLNSSSSTASASAASRHHHRHSSSSSAGAAPGSYAWQHPSSAGGGGGGGTGSFAAATHAAAAAAARAAAAAAAAAAVAARQPPHRQHQHHTPADSSTTSDNSCMSGASSYMRV